MIVETKEDGFLLLKDQDSFDPKMIFECGQAFNWTKEEDESYTTCAFSKILNVKKEGKDIILSTNREDFENLWMDYFDLQTNYEKIKSNLLIDETMDAAISYGHGIRILNQDPYETIISFIISANNRINQIKNSISLISKYYGTYIGTYRGKDYYNFPSVEVLAQADPQDLRKYCKVGFRDTRIVEASKEILKWDSSFDDLMDLPREELKDLLMSLAGVGPKVSDCIILFAFKDKSAFPVDVWIKRVMENLYLDGETISQKKVADFGREKFGPYAGVAQQYLFYYGRENAIGVQK